MPADLEPDSPSADSERVLLLATDGSEHATAALTAGLRLVGGSHRAVLVTVVPAADPSLLVGSGHAGPVMTPWEKDNVLAIQRSNAEKVLTASVAALADSAPDLAVQTEILAGDPGEEICRAAVDFGAAGIVLGTRGQGGLKRALLGSVSDHVVRNAPCPVVTVNTT